MFDKGHSSHFQDNNYLPSRGFGKFVQEVCDFTSIASKGTCILVGVIKATLLNHWVSLPSQVIE